MAQKIEAWVDSKGGIHRTEAAADYEDQREICVDQATKMLADFTDSRADPPLREARALAQWFCSGGAGYVLNLASELRRLLNGEGPALKGPQTDSGPSDETTPRQ